jgi:anti-sigma factor RsiW
VSHLGRWLTAQVDGELEGVERDRVLNHLAGCQACRQEVIALRALKRRMTALGESVADSSIAGRLIERARLEADLAARIPGSASSSSSSSSLSVPLSVHAVRWLRQPWPRQSWPYWRIVTGSAGTALVVIGVLAFMLGGGQGQGPAPKVTPAVDAYWMKHINDTGQRWANGSTRPAPSQATYAPIPVGHSFGKVRPRPSSP